MSFRFFLVMKYKEVLMECLALITSVSRLSAVQVLVVNNTIIFFRRPTEMEGKTDPVITL